MRNHPETERASRTWRRCSAGAFALALATAPLGCAPELITPGESTRVEGVVRSKTAGPITISVYDRCSSRMYFFSSCPGKFLGETRIGKPGPFLVEVDPNDSAVTIYAFRGAIGAIEECAT
ncbi:MAG: hypothetical protein QOD06_633, partial [Candidatus Binatota bacterium]|nr:hypothetical protein [Candidatus Binatota bacterium]